MEFGGEEWKERIDNLLDGENRIVVEIPGRSRRSVITRFVIARVEDGIPEIDGYTLAEEDMTKMLEDTPFSRFVNLDKEGVLRIGSEGWSSVLMDDGSAFVTSTGERDFYPDEGIDGGLEASSFVTESLTKLEIRRKDKGSDNSRQR